MATWATTNLTGHWDASDTDRLWKEAGMTNHPSDGQDVLAWDDEGDATDAALFNNVGAPWRASGINGLGSLDPAGGFVMASRTDDNSTAKPISDFLSAAAYTVFIVFQQEANAAANNGGDDIWNNTSLIGDGAARWGIVIRNASGVQTIHAYQHSGSRSDVGIGISLDTPYVARMRYDGTTVYFGLNGGSESSFAKGNISLVALQLLVCSGFSGLGFNGKVGELLTYNANLTGTDLSDTTQYLMDKWLGIGGGNQFPALTVAI